MADEALRALEREARARPDDRAAAWAYVRALERARDRHSLRLELCALARAGDATADDALARWAETGSPEPAATNVDLTRTRATVVKTKRRAPATPVAVTRGHAFCVAGRELVAHDLHDRREAWARPATECLIAAWGDDVVHLDERGQVVVRDASSGVERERLAVPFAATIIRVNQGRAVVISARQWHSPVSLPFVEDWPEERMACFDLTEWPARPLWTLEPLGHETFSVVETACGLVRLSGTIRETIERSWDVDLVDESGATMRLGRNRANEDEDSAVHAQDVITPDRRALLLRTSHGPQGATHVNELDVASGDERWRLDLPWESRDLWGSPDLALIRRRELAGPGVLVAIDRATGRARWEARPGLLDALAIVGEQVVVAALVKGDMSAIRLTSLRAADGRTVGTHELTLAVRPTDRRRAGGAARVVVASDAVRIVIAGRDVLAVVEVPAR